MNTLVRTIVRNASVLMASQIITLVLSFLLAIFIPRYLGPAALGQFNIAHSIWAIVAIFASLGMDTYLLKEVSREHGQIDNLLGTILSLRLIFFVLGALAVYGYIQLTGYSVQTSLVIFIIGISSLIGTATGTFEACLKGMERMEFPSVASITYTAILTFLGITLLLLGKGVLYIAATDFVGALASLLILFLALRKLHRPRFSIHRKLAGDVLRSSIPYWFVGLGIILYQNVDALVISWFVNENAVGLYSASDRLFGSLLFIPTIFFTALFPTLTRTYATSPDSFYKIARKSFDMLMVLSVPIGLGIFVVADPLVLLLYGNEYAKSGPVLAVLGIVLIFTYTNMLLGYLLISIDKQKAWAAILLVATLATIPLDMLLVPWCEKTFANGALGGGLSFVFTEVGQTVAGILLLPKGTLCRANAWLAARALLAGLGMVGAAWLFRDQFIAILVLVGGITYLALVLALRILSEEDWKLINAARISAVKKIRGHPVQTLEVKS